MSFEYFSAKTLQVGKIWVPMCKRLLRKQKTMLGSRSELSYKMHTLQKIAHQVNAYFHLGVEALNVQTEVEFLE